MHWKNLRTRVESWEWIILRWWATESQYEKTLELLWMGENNFHNLKQLWEDGIKLEPWISGRTGRDLREILLRSSNVENDDENHHELLRYSGRMKNKEVEPTRKNNLKPILENIWLMKFILTSNFEKNLGMAPGKLEESGKILEKDLWVRAQSKENTVEQLIERGDCTGWIKWLEWDNNLEISWTDWEWK